MTSQPLPGLHLEEGPRPRRSGASTGSARTASGSSRSWNSSAASRHGTTRVALRGADPAAVAEGDGGDHPRAGQVLGRAQADVPQRLAAVGPPDELGGPVLVGPGPERPEVHRAGGQLQAPCVEPADPRRRDEDGPPLHQRQEPPDRRAVVRFEHGPDDDVGHRPDGHALDVQEGQLQQAGRVDDLVAHPANLRQARPAPRRRARPKVPRRATRDPRVCNKIYNGLA